MTNSQNQTIRQRVRIRFRKEGDLRLIGHRDLVRTVERAVRRAGVQLSMSEGFHPKARLSFPLALAVGIASLNEVMEIDFSQAIEVESLRSLLKNEFPTGLIIDSLELIPDGTKKVQVALVEYQIPVPQEQQESATQAAQTLMQQAECLIRRPGRTKQIDLRANLAALELSGGRLKIQQTTTTTASAGPRDILAQIGLDDLEQRGHFLTRTQVQLVAT